MLQPSSHYASSRDVASSSSHLISRAKVFTAPPLPLSLPCNFPSRVSFRFQLQCASSSPASSVSPSRRSKPKPSSRKRNYDDGIPSILRSLDSSTDIETTLASLCLNLSPREQTSLLKQWTRWDRVLRMFRFFQSQQDYVPNVIHYNIVLRALGRAEKWDELRLCWIEMAHNGVLPTNNTYGMLVDVYGRAGLVKEALLWIKHMGLRGLFPDEVTMATVVRVFKNSGEFDRADRFFKDWCAGRVNLDVLDLDSIDDSPKNGSASSPVNLKQFLSMELFKVGARNPVEKSLHLTSDSSPRKPQLTSTFNTLIDLYGKAGRLNDAGNIFSEMLKSGVPIDAFTFNTMIHICGTHGQLSEAESLLKKMEEKGIFPNTKTYNTLLSLYADAGDIEAALKYYRKIKKVGLFPDTVTHRAVLHILCHRKMIQEAEDVMDEMARNNIRIDERSVPVIMQMYVNEGLIGQAKALFERFQLDCVLSSTTLAAVLDVYAEKGLWVEAEAVFYGKRDMTGQRNDILEYNIMIKAYGVAKLHEKALSLFKGMKNQGTWPNEWTYNSVVQMLAGVDLVDEAHRILAEMIDLGCKPECKTFAALIAGYVRLGLLSDAVDLYKAMKKAGVKPNEFVYGSLINGFAESGMVEEAIQYFGMMEEHGVKSNNIVLTSLIKAYSKVGCLEEARKVYEKMKDSEGGADVAASNSMLSLCAEYGIVSEAESIFNELREKGTCDIISFGTMMYLYHCMGMPDEAFEVAEEMRESGLQIRDCSSFNQVLACYAAVGQLRECCELYHEMVVEKKLSVDRVTFKTLFPLLKNCGVPSEAAEQLESAYNEAKPLATPAITATMFSATGLYSYARDSCLELTRDEIPLEHFAYNAVIYTYCATGDIDMALKTYMRMQEKGLKPDIVTQAYLVGVYGKAGMVEGVKKVHSQLTYGELEPNQSLFKAVRDAYVSANRQDLADVVEKEMSIAYEAEEEEYSLSSGESEEEYEEEYEEDEAF